MVAIASVLHQRFADFSPLLSRSLSRVFLLGTKKEPNPSDVCGSDPSLLSDEEKLSRKKFHLRFYLLLFEHRVVSDSFVLAAGVGDLTSPKPRAQLAQGYVAATAGFAKQAKGFLAAYLDKNIKKENVKIDDEGKGKEAEEQKEKPADNDETASKEKAEEDKDDSNFLSFLFYFTK